MTTSSPAPPPAPGRMPHPLRDRGFAAVYAAAWLPVVAAYAVGITAAGAPVRAALQSAVFTAGPAALLGTVVIGGAAALAVRRRGIALVLAHAGRALVFATLWCGATAAQIYAFAPRRAFDAFLRDSASWQWVSAVFLYGVLAGVGHAVAVGRLLREREAAAARAELHALRAQLDPHFLFNTLHSLTALARRDPAAVERGLERFGDLLRYVLDASRREAADDARDDARGDVPLEDELRFVRDYLALEHMRLGERLRVAVDVDDEALECVLPALTLQPLVENAVRHGLAPRAAGGTVRVRARVTDDGALVVEVADDGAGCDAAAAARAPGVGIAVVRRRLRARYGDAAALDVTSAPGQGFVARVTLPARAGGARVPAGTWAVARTPHTLAPAAVPAGRP